MQHHLHKTKNVFTANARHYWNWSMDGRQK